MVCGGRKGKEREVVCQGRKGKERRCVGEGKVKRGGVWGKER